MFFAVRAGGSGRPRDRARRLSTFRNASARRLHVPCERRPRRRGWRCWARSSSDRTLRRPPARRLPRFDGRCTIGVMTVDDLHEMPVRMDAGSESWNSSAVLTRLRSSSSSSPGKSRSSRRREELVGDIDVLAQQRHGDRGEVPDEPAEKLPPTDSTHLARSSDVLPFVPL